MAFSNDDTIVAIATPAGRGGIGVVRISGPGAASIAGVLTGGIALQPRHATFTHVRGTDTRDESIVTFFPGPRSYTGEDIVELSLHGSPVLLRSVVHAAMTAGARLAEPGEFTLRAYLSGRLDLVQAEAVRDLVDAVTPLQVRTACDQLDGTLTAQIGRIDKALFDLAARLEASIDFAEEGYHFVTPEDAAADLDALLVAIDRLLADARAGRLVREGARVVLIGRPNAGKSTLFNALAGAARAIVTDVPGTTRDLLTEKVEIGGLAVTLVDTAGLRIDTDDAIESEGMSRARAAALDADLQVLLLDRSSPLMDEDHALIAETSAAPRLLVATKTDLAPVWTDLPGARITEVAAAAGRGLDVLRTEIVAALGASEALRDTPAVTNVRHVRQLDVARAALERARDAALAQAPEELIAADLTEAREALEEITGRRTVDDTLAAIFERFCIGK
jgi:tRNA modification GTPase